MFSIQIKMEKKMKEKSEALWIFPGNKYGIISLPVIVKSWSALDLQTRASKGEKYILWEICNDVVESAETMGA